MTDKPTPYRIIDEADIEDELPPEARCQRPFPHHGHHHEIQWRDIIGGHWCEGTA